MSQEEYKNAIFCAAEISRELTLMLNQRGMDLFEAYGNIYEKILKYEINE